MKIRSLGLLILPFVALTSCESPPTNQSEPEAKTRTYSYDINDECYYTAACYSVMVGSSEVDTDKLTASHARWTQRTPNNDAWELSPAMFDEKLETTENGNWRHVQTILVDGAARKIDTRIFDKNTLQILEYTIAFVDPPEGQPLNVKYDLTQDEVIGKITMPDGTISNGKPRTKKVPMFDGQVAGLALATLPLSDGYVGTLPTIIPNLGVYWLEVSVVGKKPFPLANGKTIDVWEVYANWLNLDDGDVYEPGPDSDGGAYYMAVNPGNGVPAVIEYANSGARITWDGVKRVP